MGRSKVGFEEGIVLLGKSDMCCLVRALCL